MLILWRLKSFIKWSMTFKVIYNQFYAKRYDFSIKWYMTWNITFMLWRSFVNFFTFDQITILTYFLMDNFCPCFLKDLLNSSWYHLIYLYSLILYSDSLLFCFLYFIALLIQSKISLLFFLIFLWDPLDLSYFLLWFTFCYSNSDSKLNKAIIGRAFYW